MFLGKTNFYLRIYCDSSAKNHNRKYDKKKTGIKTLQQTNPNSPFNNNNN